VTTWGVTPTGFRGKPLTTISEEVDTGLKLILGDSAGTEPDGTIPLSSMAGQLKSLIVDGLAESWDLAQSIYANFDPTQATDQPQDALYAITGLTRSPSRSSVATGIFVGNPNTQLEAGRIVGVTGFTGGAKFTNTTALTLSAASAWAGTTVYAVGNIVTNASRVYRCITAGTSAGSGGPTTTSLDITDNTVHWRYLGEGTAYVTAPMLAQDTGPIGGLANLISNIITPVAGWNAVNNAANAEIGANQETNAAYRARRESALAAPGNTTVDAIRANVLAVNAGSTDPAHQPATSCTVFFNDTDFTDANGLPPHSVEVLVLGGTTADIAQAILDSVGAGTATFGTRSDTVEDSEGNDQVVYWSRPVEIPIWVIATGYYDPAQWTAAANGASAVSQYMLSALLTYGSDYPVAQDVRSSPIMAAFLRGPAQVDDLGAAVYPAEEGSPAIPGMVETDVPLIGVATGPTASAQITIGTREIATFAPARITITAIGETP